MLVGMSACGAPAAKEVTPQACIDPLNSSSEIVKLTTEVIQVNTELNYKRISSDAAVENLDVIRPKGPSRDRCLDGGW
jgi:hypothetical protein